MAGTGRSRPVPCGSGCPACGRSLEIGLHRVDADEQGVGHLPVGAAGGHQLRHPRLGRGQVNRRGGPAPTRRQLRAGPLHPRSRAEPLELSRACVSVSRASRFLFARRSTAPFTNSVRPSSKGRGRRSCLPRPHLPQPTQPRGHPGPRTRAPGIWPPSPWPRPNRGVGLRRRRVRGAPRPHRAARGLRAPRLHPGHPEVRGLPNAHRLLELDGSGQIRIGLGGSAQGKLEEPQDRQVRDQEEDLARRLGDPQPFEGFQPRRVGPPRWASTRPTAKWPSDDMGPIRFRSALALLSRACSMAASQLPARHSSSARWYRNCACDLHAVRRGITQELGERPAGLVEAIGVPRSCATTKLHAGRET